MAVKKTIELEVEVGDLKKDLESIQKEFEEIKNSIKGVEKESKKQTQATEKGFKGLRTAANKVRKGISGIGLAFKALGIGIFLKAFQFLSEAFLSNQKAADGLAVVTGTIQKIFRDFVDLIINNVGNITNAFKAFFEDPVQNIKQFALSIKEGIIDRFNEFKETLGIIGQAVGKLFKGDFAGAVEDLKTAGKEAVDVITGVDGSFEDVKEKVTNAASAVKEYVTGTASAVNASVKLANAARLAAANQELLRIENLKSAEEQRQLRDDTSKSIEDRIAANNKLAEILTKGAEDELKLAKTQLDAAEAARALDDESIETAENLIAAKAKVAEIEERVTGILSEQKTNEVALREERLASALEEQELATNKLDLENQTANVGEKNQLRLIELEKERIDAAILASEQRLALVEKEFGIESEQFKQAQREQTQFAKEQSLARTQLTQNEQDAKREITLKTLALIQSAVGEGTVVAKAAAIASSIINTREAFTAALGKKPYTFGNIAFAAATLAAGFAQVKKIVATKIPGGKDTGGSVGVDAATAALPPAFNVVGQSPINQLAQTIGGQQPVKAYVVSSDVTTAQQLDRNIINESGI